MSVHRRSEREAAPACRVAGSRYPWVSLPALGPTHIPANQRSPSVFRPRSGIGEDSVDKTSGAQDGCQAPSEHRWRLSVSGRLASCSRSDRQCAPPAARPKGPRFSSRKQRGEPASARMAGQLGCTRLRVGRRRAAQTRRLERMQDPVAVHRSTSNCSPQSSCLGLMSLSPLMLACRVRRDVFDVEHLVTRGRPAGYYSRDRYRGDVEGWSPRRGPE